MSAQIWSMIGQGILETLQMTLISSLLAYIFGVPVGVLLVTTDKNGVLENRPLNLFLGAIVNVFRSIPFLILLVFLIPFTRLITGASIGTKATIVPLTVGAIPIVARMVESSLKEVNVGIIEAAKSMGASSKDIILRFMIPEAMPSLFLGAAINIATILGYSAMAGVIGGGGIGAIALNYGYYRYQTDILWVTVAILIVMVEVFQEGGLRLSNRIRRS